MSRSITINTDASRLHACRPVNASRSSHQHLSLRASSSLSPALVRVQRPSENPPFRLATRVRRVTAASVRDAYQSIAPQTPAADAGRRRRGIRRRKFPVAKIHDLYIGIGPSTSQRPNCFQTTGRGVCQRLFAGRPRDAYTSIHNPSFRDGMRNSLQPTPPPVVSSRICPGPEVAPRV